MSSSSSSTMFSSLRPDAVEFTPFGVTPPLASTPSSSPPQQSSCTTSPLDNSNPLSATNDKPNKKSNNDNEISSSNNVGGTRKDRNNSSASSNWINSNNSPTANQTRLNPEAPEFIPITSPSSYQTTPIPTQQQPSYSTPTQINTTPHPTMHHQHHQHHHQQPHPHHRAPPTPQQPIPPHSAHHPVRPPPRHQQQHPSQPPVVNQFQPVYLQHPHHPPNANVDDNSPPEFFPIAHPMHQPHPVMAPSPQDRHHQPHHQHYQQSHPRNDSVGPPPASSTTNTIASSSSTPFQHPTSFHQHPSPNTAVIYQPSHHESSERFPSQYSTEQQQKQGSITRGRSASSTAQTNNQQQQQSTSSSSSAVHDSSSSSSSSSSMNADAPSFTVAYTPPIINPRIPSGSFDISTPQMPQHQRFPQPALFHHPPYPPAYPSPDPSTATVYPQIYMGPPAPGPQIIPPPNPSTLPPHPQMIPTTGSPIAPPTQQPMQQHLPPSQMMQPEQHIEQYQQPHHAATRQQRLPSSHVPAAALSPQQRPSGEPAPHQVPVMPTRRSGSGDVTHVPPPSQPQHHHHHHDDFQQSSSTRSSFHQHPRQQQGGYQQGGRFPNQGGGRGRGRGGPMMSGSGNGGTGRGGFPNNQQQRGAVVGRDMNGPSGMAPHQQQSSYQPHRRTSSTGGGSIEKLPLNQPPQSQHPKQKQEQEELKLTAPPQTQQPKTVTSSSTTATATTTPPTGGQSSSTAPDQSTVAAKPGPPSWADRLKQGAEKPAVQKTAPITVPPVAIPQVTNAQASVVTPGGPLSQPTQQRTGPRQQQQQRKGQQQHQGGRGDGAIKESVQQSGPTNSRTSGGENHRMANGVLPANDSSEFKGIHGRNHNREAKQQENFNQRHPNNAVQRDQQEAPQSFSRQNSTSNRKQQQRGTKQQQQQQPTSNDLRRDSLSQSPPSTSAPKPISPTTPSSSTTSSTCAATSWAAIAKGGPKSNSAAVTTNTIPTTQLPPSPPQSILPSDSPLKSSSLKPSVSTPASLPPSPVVIQPTMTPPSLPIDAVQTTQASPPMAPQTAPSTTASVPLVSINKFTSESPTARRKIGNAPLLKQPAPSTTTSSVSVVSPIPPSSKVPVSFGSIDAVIETEMQSATVMTSSEQQKEEPLKPKQEAPVVVSAPKKSEIEVVEAAVEAPIAQNEEQVKPVETFIEKPVEQEAQIEEKPEDVRKESEVIEEEKAEEEIKEVVVVEDKKEMEVAIKKVEIERIAIVKEEKEVVAERVDEEKEKVEEREAEVIEKEVVVEKIELVEEEERLETEKMEERVMESTSEISDSVDDLNEDHLSEDRHSEAATEESQLHETKHQPKGKLIEIPSDQVYPIALLLQIRTALFPDGLGMESSPLSRQDTGGDQMSYPLPWLLSRKPDSFRPGSNMRIPDDLRKKDGGVSSQMMDDSAWRPRGGGASPSTGRSMGMMMGSKVGGGSSQTPIRGGNTGRHGGNRGGGLERSQSGRGEMGEKSVEDIWRVGRPAFAPPEGSRLHHAKNITDQAEVLRRKLVSILNKLTVEKFDSLYEQIKGAGMTGDDDVRRLMEMICDKAKHQHHFIPMYVRLCSMLQKDLTEMEIIENGGAGFRRLLVDACQQSFEETLKPIEIPEGLSEEESFEWLLLEKKKMKGNMIFVAELHKKKMIAAKVLMGCVEVLLSNKGEAQLEALCELLVTAGKWLDTSKFKETLEEKMKEIKGLIVEDGDLSTRIRCLLQDVVDDWKNGWVKAAKERDGPKTLDQIHQQAASEEMKQKANLNRGGSQAYGASTSLTSSRYQQQEDDFQVVNKRGGKSSRQFTRGDTSTMGRFGSTGGGSPSGASRDTGRRMMDGDNDHSHHSQQRGRVGQSGMVISGYNGKQQSSQPSSSYQRGDSSEPSNQRDVASFFGGRNLSAISSSMQPISAPADSSRKSATTSATPAKPTPFNKEDCKEKLETLKLSLVTSRDYSDAVQLLKSFLATMSDVDLPYLIGHTIFLIADSRTMEQPIISKWLMHWKTEDLVDDAALTEGLRDFIQNRYEGTYPDCPKLADVLINIVLKEAKEMSALSSPIIDTLIEEVKAADAKCV